MKRAIAIDLDTTFSEVNDVQRILIAEVIAERIRQQRKHGKQNDHHTPHKWLVILNEEVGEVSKAINETDLLNYYEELVQVAAVAMAALEDISNELARRPD